MQEKEAVGIEMLLFLGLEALVNHLSTQESQECEGYPVVTLLHQSAETGCRHPAQERHEGLKQPERKRGQDDCPPVNTFQNDAAGYGDSQTVHRKANGK